jgi:hypothetical protein
VEEVLVKVGQDLKPGTRILQFTGGCSHPTIMKVRWDGWRILVLTYLILMG